MLLVSLFKDTKPGDEDVGLEETFGTLQLLDFIVYKLHELRTASMSHFLSSDDEISTEGRLQTHGWGLRRRIPAIELSSSEGNETPQKLSSEAAGSVRRTWKRSETDYNINRKQKMKIFESGEGRLGQRRQRSREILALRDIDYDKPLPGRKAMSLTREYGFDTDDEHAIETMTPGRESSRLAFRQLDDTRNGVTGFWVTQDKDCIEKRLSGKKAASKKRTLSTDSDDAGVIEALIPCKVRRVVGCSKDSLARVMEWDPSDNFVSDGFDKERMDEQLSSEKRLQMKRTLSFYNEERNTVGALRHSEARQAVSNTKDQLEPVIDLHKCEFREDPDDEDVAEDCDDMEALYVSKKQKSRAVLSDSLVAITAWRRKFIRLERTEPNFFRSKESGIKNSFKDSARSYRVRGISVTVRNRLGLREVLETFGSDHLQKARKKLITKIIQFLRWCIVCSSCTKFDACEEEA
ncbi:hypothetical protein FGB62_277g04 [Gracilaria domingensis]|nr:hypothetical protein FGB62_277g04 [Gracilaria domingensis]